jgi:hypothetical protein
MESDVNIDVFNNYKDTNNEKNTTNERVFLNDF